MTTNGHTLDFLSAEQADYRRAAEMLAAAQAEETATVWPEPQPIGSELPPVLPLNEELLPEALRPLCADVAERMQVPLDFPSVAAVLCLAGATNRRARIQPKAEDSAWLVVPNLWGGIVAAPGFMKSPVVHAITAPLREVSELWRAEHESEMAAHAEAVKLSELRRRAWEQKVIQAEKAGKETPLRPDDSTAEPRERRLIVNDCTFEALHKIMADNPAGVMVVRDELTGWLASLDRQGREGERAFCLQAWNGDTDHTIDRIGRGSIHVPACCMSMLGGIQPGRLRSYLCDALRDGPSNDGLIQRFQLLIWPDSATTWNYIDRPPNARASAAAKEVYRRLAAMDAEFPARLRFAPDAQELFVAWLSELEAKVRGDELHPALVAHIAKYRSLMPSLAALFELADGGLEVISLAHTRQAAAWCEYLESHARRVYSCVAAPALRAAAELARRIRGGWRADKTSFRLREVYLCGWSGLDTPGLARAACQALEDADWLRRIDPVLSPDGGRPAEEYAINPRCREVKK